MESLGKSASDGATPKGTKTEDQKKKVSTAFHPPNVYHSTTAAGDGVQDNKAKLLAAAAQPKVEAAPAVAPKEASAPPPRGGEEKKEAISIEESKSPVAGAAGVSGLGAGAALAATSGSNKWRRGSVSAVESLTRDLMEIIGPLLADGGAANRRRLAERLDPVLNTFQNQAYARGFVSNITK